MAEVNLRSWPEISQAADGLQLNPTVVEYIFAKFTQFETQLDEIKHMVVATHPPFRPEPDPPDGPPLYAAAQPPYHPYKPPPPPNTLRQTNPSSYWYPPYRREQLGYPHYDNGYSSLPPKPMPEPYKHNPSPTPESDDPCYHYQPLGELYPPVYNGNGESSNSYNYSVDEYSPYTDSWQTEDRPSSSLPPPDRLLHSPSWLPSYCSPAVAAVRQPPQLRSSYSWVDMPRQHAQNSTSTSTALAIAPPATTQVRSCHEQPVVVPQPLLRPTSPCCSALTSMAAAAVPRPPQPRLSFYSHPLPVTDKVSCTKIAEVIVAPPHKGVAPSLIKQRKEKSFKGKVDLNLQNDIDEKSTTAKIEFFLMVDVLTLHQLCASLEHLHIFDPGGDTSSELLFVTLFVLTWFPP